MKQTTKFQIVFPYNLQRPVEAQSFIVHFIGRKSAIKSVCLRQLKVLSLGENFVLRIRMVSIISSTNFKGCLTSSRQDFKPNRIIRDFKSNNLSKKGKYDYLKTFSKKSSNSKHVLQVIGLFITFESLIYD